MRLEVIEDSILTTLQFNSRTICADDLHELYPHITEKRIFGTALANLVKAKKIRFVGVKKSERELCHHRPIMVYELNG